MQTERPQNLERPEQPPHFSEATVPEDAPAWEEIDTGRYMPRRIRGSYRGRALG